jgi:cyclin-dependent kinase 14
MESDPTDKWSRNKMPYTTYSDEFLDRIEPNGNISHQHCDKDHLHCGNFIFIIAFKFLTRAIAACAEWPLGERNPVRRQLSVSSDSKLLDEDLREEAKVILRPKRPPRPKSEVFLNRPHGSTKRYSAFGVLFSALKKNVLLTEILAGRLPVRKIRGLREAGATW